MIPSFVKTRLLMLWCALVGHRWSGWTNTQAFSRPGRVVRFRWCRRCDESEVRIEED